MCTSICLDDRRTAAGTKKERKEIRAEFVNGTEKEGNRKAGEVRREAETSDTWQKECRVGSNFSFYTVGRAILGQTASQMKRD